MPKEVSELVHWFESFSAALSGEDDLGLVVRAHIHIEHELEEFISAAAPNASQIKFSEMDYDGKVRLALVLGLNPEIKSALNAAGTLRNKFSHRLEMKLGEQEAKNLFAIFTPKNLKALQALYIKHVAKDKSHNLLRASVRDRIQMFFIGVFSNLIAQRNLLENKD